MSLRDAPKPQVDALITGYLVGQASAAEVQQLDELLRRDPAVAERFARACRTEVALHEGLAGATSPASVPVADHRQAAVATRRSPRRQRRRVRSASRPWTAAIVAAALLLLGILFWHQSVPRSPVAPGEPVAPLVTEPDQEALAPRQATLSKLDADGLVLLDGRPVAEQAVVRGPASIACEVMARLDLADGSSVVLQPGTRLHVETGPTGTRLRLATAAVACSVVPQGPERSFRVDSPHGSITVIGTRFSVAVSEDRSRVRVQEGRVAVRDLQGAERHLLSSEQVELGPDGFTSGANAAAPPPAIRGLVLIDAGRDRPITEHDPLVDGAVLSLASLPAAGINIRCDARADIAAVRWRFLEGSEVPFSTGYCERFLPFSLARDTDGDYQAWQPEPGAYQLSVQGYADDDGKEAVGEPYGLRFVVTP